MGQNLLNPPRRGKGNEALRSVLQTIAQKRGKSTSQVALNWLLHRDEHIIPIPGVTSAGHAWENADTHTWQLSDEEFCAIDQASRAHEEISRTSWRTDYPKRA